MKTADPRELEAIVGACRQKIQEADISRRQRDVLHCVVTWSFVRGREWAEFESGEHLGVLAGIAHKQNVWNALNDLAAIGWLHVTKRRGNWVRCRFLPSGQLLEPPMKIEQAALEEAWTLAEKLNELPDGFDPGGQSLLPLETDTEHVDAAIASASRETLALQPGERAAIEALKNAGVYIPGVRRDVIETMTSGRSETPTCHQNDDNFTVAKAEVVIESMTSPPSASGGLHIDAGARAPGDSVESILIDDSNESESCGSLQKTGKQHRDGEVNLLLDRLQKLDPEDFAKGRGQWINRATGSPKAGDDCRRELVDAVSAVEHARLLGESFRKPLGKVFALARKWSVDHGKKLRSVLFT